MARIATLATASAARASALAAALLLAGCAGALQSSDGFFSRITPYRIDVVQGNVVTKDLLDQIKPGLTRAQVRDLLGSPLLTDPFHDARWDYIFTLRSVSLPAQRMALTLYFQGDALQRTESSQNPPSEKDFVAALRRSSGDGRAAPLELTEAERKALPVPKAAPAAAPEDVGPIRPYPPLEPGA